ncbi:hypothetical protein F4778DRAFT_745615 [Xylariomycetidae sp. FL2044]|nr:hypothetical protein F4778DRAFT_745615 [Xylariomycetidae sp. FL2044]
MSASGTPSSHHPRLPAEGAQRQSTVDKDQRNRGDEGAVVARDKYRFRRLFTENFSAELNLMIADQIRSTPSLIWIVFQPGKSKILFPDPSRVNQELNVSPAWRSFPRLQFDPLFKIDIGENRAPLRVRETDWFFLDNMILYMNWRFLPYRSSFDNIGMKNIRTCMFRLQDIYRGICHAIDVPTELNLDPPEPGFEYRDIHHYEKLADYLYLVKNATRWKECVILVGDHREDALPECDAETIPVTSNSEPVGGKPQIGIEEPSKHPLTESEKRKMRFVHGELTRWRLYHREWCYQHLRGDPCLDDKFQDRRNAFARWLDNTRDGRSWLATPHGEDWLKTEAGLWWLGSDYGWSWLDTAEGFTFLESGPGRTFLQSPAGQNWLRRDSVISEHGVQMINRPWIKTAEGRRWMDQYHSDGVVPPAAEIPMRDPDRDISPRIPERFFYQPPPKWRFVRWRNPETAVQEN